MKHTTQPPAVTITTATHIRPEYFPLPSRGLDPYFGLSRSDYYRMENARMVRLVRMRRPGLVLGKVLVPYEAVSALIHQMQAKQGQSQPENN